MAKYSQVIKKSKQVKHPVDYKSLDTSPYFDFDEAFSVETLSKCYKKATAGKKGESATAVEFDLYAEYLLTKLSEELLRTKEKPSIENDYVYKPGPYHFKTIHEPKERNLSIPELRDKIVQLAAHEVLVKLFRPCYIQSSYACLEHKGQIRAALGVMHDLRVAKHQWGSEAVIIRIDIRKFFYNIDRDILKWIICKRFRNIKKKYRSLYHSLLRLYNLLCKIIDLSPEGEKGIPLGNVTSQDFANIVLNELDQFCVRFLKIRYYKRYMDDVVISAPNKEIAKIWLSKIISFISVVLHLEVNEKTKIFHIDQGVNAFGYKIKATHMRVRTNSKRKMQRKAKMFVKKLRELDTCGKVICYPYCRGSEREELLKRCQQSFSAWIGFARWSCSFNLVKKVVRRYPQLPIYIKGDLPFGIFCRVPKTKPNIYEFQKAA